MGLTGIGGLSVQDVTEDVGEPVENMDEEDTRGGICVRSGGGMRFTPLLLPPLLSLSPRLSVPAAGKTNTVIKHIIRDMISGAHTICLSFPFCGI